MIKNESNIAILEKVIKTFKPFPQSEIKKYEFIKAKMEGKSIEQKNDRPRIEFKMQKN